VSTQIVFARKRRNRVYDAVTVDRVLNGWTGLWNLLIFQRLKRNFIIFRLRFTHNREAPDTNWLHETRESYSAVLTNAMLPFGECG
jgi:hypothetical protein